jgi:hypothetical protein
MANHMANIEWTPVAPIPVSTGANTYKTVPAGQTQKGIPYSSVRSVCKYVGTNVSLYTFMTALQNPRSVLYTRKIKAGTLGATYYGTVCSDFPAYSFGMKGRHIGTGVLQSFCTEISQYEIQKGDLLYAIEGIKVITSEDVEEVLSGYKVGDTVTLTIVRFNNGVGNEYSAKLTLKEYVPSDLNVQFTPQ